MRPGDAHRAPISAVAITPEGNVVSASYDGEVWEWAVDQDRLRPLSRHRVAEKNVNAVAVSSCGRHIASGASDGRVALVQRPEGQVRWLAHPGDVECLAFTGEGEWIASGGTNGELRIHRVSDGERENSHHHGGTIGALAFAPDGRLATVCNDGVLRIFTDAVDLQLVAAFRLATLPLKSVAWSAGALFVGGHDARMYRVEPSSGEAYPIATFTSTPKSLASSDGRVAVAVYDSTVRIGSDGLRGIDDLALVESSPRTWAHGVALTRDLLAAGSFDGTPRVWREEDGAWVKVGTASSEVPCISSICLKDDVLAVGGDSGVLRRAKTGEAILALGEAITCVARCMDGVAIATWSGNLHLRVGVNGSEVFRLAEAPLVCMDAAGDTVVAGLYTGGIVCFDAKAGTVRWRSQDATGAVKCVALGRDLVAVVGRYDGLRVLDATTGVTLARLPLGTSVSDAVLFDATGARLAAAAGAGEVWIIAVERSLGGTTVEVLHRSAGHLRPVAQLSSLLGVSALAHDGVGGVIAATFDGAVTQLVTRGGGPWTSKPI